MKSDLIFKTDSLYENPFRNMEYAILNPFTSTHHFYTSTTHINSKKQAWRDFKKPFINGIIYLHLDKFSCDSGNKLVYRLILNQNIKTENLLFKTAVYSNYKEKIADSSH
jgi:hypothetical protein